MAKSQKKARLPTPSTKANIKPQREADVGTESNQGKNDESVKEIQPQECEKKSESLFEENPQQEQENKQEQSPEEDRQEERMRSLSKQIGELSSLSSAIVNFKRSFFSLQKHLDSVRSSIEQTFKEYPIVKEIQHMEVESSGKKTPESNGAVKDEADAKTSEKSLSESDVGAQEKLSVEQICRSMSGKILRRYLHSNMTDANLRDELLEGLKLAPNPAKLVLESVGKFYLQGKKAFAKVSPLITARDAAVLLLEILLLVIGSGEVEIEIENTTKEEAQKGAAAWLSRLKHEGSVNESSEIDARGLLLFIACFGIPSSFNLSDIVSLFQASDLQLLSGSLKGSDVLLQKITDILGAMKNQKLFVTATEVACIFGVENKFSPLDLLTSCLKDSEERYKKETQSKKGSVIEMKAAASKHVACLKEVAKCVADHGWDLTEIGGVKLKEKIPKLEKEIAELLKKSKEETSASKRRLEEFTQEHKRAKYAPSTTPGMYLNGLPDPSPYSGGGGVASRPYDLPYQTGFEGSRYQHAGEGPTHYAMRPLDGPSSTLGRSLAGHSSVIDRFPGLPSRSAGAGHGGDLYGFADQVVEGGVSRRVDMTGLARGSAYSLSHHLY